MLANRGVANRSIPSYTGEDSWTGGMKAKTVPIEDVDGRCNCLAVCKAARYLRAAYDKALAPSELRATQFAILCELAKHGPMTIKQLATLMAMDRTTLATNLKPLEREGLLSVAPAQDRRARNIQITNLGRKRYTHALPLWAGAQARFEAAYGGAKAAKLHKSLGEVLGTGFEPWAE
jgi:DNA-binding MarR family transcriptional regulator